MEHRFDYEAIEGVVKSYLNTPEANKTKSGKYFPFRSRFDHILRVRSWCVRIAKEEKLHAPVDEELLYLAATLHDVGYAINKKKHAAESARILVSEIVKCGVPEDFCARAAAVVARHSEKENFPGDMPVELRILQDADVLDEIGLMGVLWASMTEGAAKEQSYVKTRNAIHALFEKELAAKRFLKTATGERFYARIMEETRGFLASLDWQMCFIPE